MPESSPTLLERLMLAAQRYIAYCAILFLVIITLRFYETFVICNFCHFPENSFRAELYGLLCDGYVFLRICAFGVLPFSLLFILKPIIAEYFMSVVLVFIFLITLVLQLWFASSMVPLGTELFNYSFFKLIQTVVSSCGFLIFLVIPFLLFTAYILLLWRYWRNKNFPSVVFYIFYLAVAISLLVKDYSSPSSGIFQTEMENYLACNKLGFVVSKTYHLFKEEETKRKQHKEHVLNIHNVDSSKNFCLLSVNLFNTNENPIGGCAFFKILPDLSLPSCTTSNKHWSPSLDLY